MLHQLLPGVARPDPAPDRPAIPGRDSLPPCRSRFNCVCSREDGLRRHRIEPIGFPGDPDAAFARVTQLVANTRRTRVLTATDRYLHARCRTRIGFVDDLELLLCRRRGVIQVRSASRIGIYDFGVNRRRVERLRRRFERTVRVERALPSEIRRAGRRCGRSRRP